MLHRAPIFLLLFLINCSTRSNGPAVVSTPLPTPSGPYPIGTSVYHLSPNVDGAATEMMVQVWYPSAPSDGGPAFYLPDTAIVSGMEKDEYLNLSTSVLESWKYIKTHSALDAPVAAEPALLPLLIFSHGFGVSRSNYTSFAEDFASHGIIVAAIDHPNAGMTILPNGKVLPLTPDPQGPDHRAVEMAREASAVLDQLLKPNSTIGRFAPRIDKESIGMLGHSLGGAAALNVGAIDPRFKAAADLDGYPFGDIMTKGVAIPFLAMLQQPGDPIHVSDSMKAARNHDWATVIGRQKTRAIIVTISGASHFNFSDLPFMVPDSLMKRNGGTLEPWRGHEIMTSILRSFFAQYLSIPADQSTIDSVARVYPEVSMKTFRP